MTRHMLRLLVSAVGLVLGIAAIAEAGGPLLLRAPGQPFRWAHGGVGIPFNPDLGGLGPLTHAQAVAQTTAAFQAWADVPSAVATHTNAGELSVDVDETNFLPFLQPLAPDGLSAIVYDEDGAIFELLFGPDSGILGFASPEWLNNATGEIVEGVAFMNGGSLLGPGAFPVADFLAVQVHEFGHYQNLAHTVVNGQAAGFGDTTGPTPNNTFARPSFLGRIETMYPFLFVGGGQETPHKDDIAMFSFLYPEPSFATSTGTIAGRVIAPNNTTPLTGVNVIARNVANPFDDAVSAISGDFAGDPSSGAPFAGTYTLRGLTPGAQYAVFVDQILDGGFSTDPRTLPGPEEFYNGSAESNDAATDDPSVFTAVAPTAGVPITGIDIVFNRTPPGPIQLTDDGSFEIFTNFRLRFCGQTYESVWVNANGSLSFGAPVADFSESAAELLQGPPRIAGVWDDLNPEGGGVVSFDESSSALTVRFTGVPEFPAVGANTFAFTLRRQTGSATGGRFVLEYGDVSALDGAAGYSCGGKTTSGFEGETNLSKHKIPSEVAVYEVFTTDNDLDRQYFDIVTPNPFKDPFEPNDSLTSRRPPIQALPFSTHAQHTAIDAGDVDFYRFRARAGDILAIETVPGTPLDTMVGLFDAAGTLLILDDDGGVGGTGSLSRLLVQVNVDGVYAVGVTTWPDYGFTGAGNETGRYVLSVRSYRGTVLPMSDDGSIQVPLTQFQFPFQGTLWSSVFVNGNGNLTFGAPNSDFSESVAELLSGPPRIAPLWDDLSPANLFTGALQGLVIVDETSDSLYVHYVSVPEFEATGTNYFSVRLVQDGVVLIDYGATNRSDALAGVSPGGGAANPGPSDLSLARFFVNGTTYEQFGGSFATFGGNDLSFLTNVIFKLP